MAHKRGKRYREAFDKVDRTNAYPPAEAISSSRNDSRRSRVLTSVTRACMFRHIEAYSQPTTPAP